jgi:hypothetical protein
LGIVRACKSEEPAPPLQPYSTKLKPDEIWLDPPQCHIPAFLLEVVNLESYETELSKLIASVRQDIDLRKQLKAKR